jgi:GH25 family lysozyme M1 (1,4-beta-N-acetylmuramidase)
MIIADTNEFHPLIDAKKYRDAKESDGTNHPIVIMRATYGTSREDLQYTKSFGQARNAGLLIGHYGYMVASEDAHTQGVFFGEMVLNNGGLKAGDSIWCDAEEGAGDQTPRVQAFLRAAHKILHDNHADEGVYSGASFWATQLKSMPSTRALRWVAAYGQSDPKLAGEDLWQFTDHHVVDGVSGPCDASIFKGTVEDFKKLVMPPATPPPPVSSGPYRHEVHIHSTSLDVLAAGRKTTFDHIVELSLQHLDPNHVAVFNAYLALRRAMRDVGAPSPVMPIGFVYFTSSK